MYAVSLRCTSCGRRFGLDEAVYTCPSCGGLLDVEYDYERIGLEVIRRKVEEQRTYGMWRYSELLPVEAEHIVSLGEGFTPLVEAGKSWGLPRLRFKLEFTCPTGSFKDRGASMMVSHAKALGAGAVAVDSSGNAAAAVAGYAARAGMRCFVFTPSYASVAKLAQSLAYGAAVFAVEGTRGDAYESAVSGYREFGWYYCGFQSNPYAGEGLKTVAYEICEQLSWDPPDWVVIPVGAGNNLVACWKGLRELHRLGWIPRLPSLVAVQAEGCAPIAQAYMRGAEKASPVEKPKTVAEGLMIADSLKSGPALKALTESRGLAETVSDEEILRAGKLLAEREGIFVEPSASAAMAGVIKLVGRGAISRDASVVCVLTGSGLKAREAYAQLIGSPTVIKPGLESLKAAIGATR